MICETLFFFFVCLVLYTLLNNCQALKDYGHKLPRKWMKIIIFVNVVFVFEDLVKLF